MGCYINPAKCTKEEWLAAYGKQTSEPCMITMTHVPVCLVANPAFTAAAVGYAPHEVERLLEGLAGRDHLWFKVKREDVRTVSPLANYEKHSHPEDFPNEN